MASGTWHALLRETSVKKYFETIPKINLISTTTDATSVTALKLLTEHGILSVPVFDAPKNKWVAFIDMVDIVAVASRMFEEKRGIGEFYATAMNDEDFVKKSVGEIIGASNRNPFIAVDYESDDLGDVVSILSNRGAHRVPVMKGNELIGVITQSQILDWVWEHKKTVAHLNAINIKVLELAVYRDIVTVHEETKALQAFRLMDYARVSGVAVVDDNNEMLSVLSVKDLRVIADPKFDRVNFSDVLLSAREFVIKAHDPEHLGHKASAGDLKARHPMASAVHEDATFELAVNKLHLTKIHRLFVVDSHNKVVGCIALRDVLRVILKN